MYVDIVYVAWNFVSFSFHPENLENNGNSKRTATPMLNNIKLLYAYRSSSCCFHRRRPTENRFAADACARPRAAVASDVCYIISSAMCAAQIESVARGADEYCFCEREVPV